MSFTAWLISLSIMLSDFMSGSKNCGTFYTMEFYSAERKKGLLPLETTWMKLESIMLREISQTVKDKYDMISPVGGT